MIYIKKDNSPYNKEYIKEVIYEFENGLYQNVINDIMKALDSEDSLDEIVKDDKLLSLYARCIIKNIIHKTKLNLNIEYIELAEDVYNYDGAEVIQDMIEFLVPKSYGRYYADRNSIMINTISLNLMNIPTNEKIKLLNNTIKHEIRHALQNNELLNDIEKVYKCKKNFQLSLNDRNKYNEYYSFLECELDADEYSINKKTNNRNTFEYDYINNYYQNKIEPNNELLSLEYKCDGNKKQLNDILHQEHELTNFIAYNTIMNPEFYQEEIKKYNIYELKRLKEALEYGKIKEQIKLNEDKNNKYLEEKINKIEFIKNKVDNEKNSNKHK